MFVVVNLQDNLVKIVHIILKYKINLQLSVFTFLNNLINILFCLFALNFRNFEYYLGAALHLKENC